MGIQLSILNLGKILIDKNLIISNSNVATEENPEKQNYRLSIPVQAFLLQCDDKNILFDTGCNTDAMGENGRWPIEYQNQVCHIRKKEETILEQLGRFNLKPEDINLVILSHMHNDHAGSLELFKNALVYVHKEEFYACLESYAVYDSMSSYIWKDTDTWIKEQWKWNFIEENDTDINITKEIRIINLGSGHTRGDLALMVSLEHYGNVILASDAIYCSENINPKLCLPGVVYDTIGWKQSVLHLQRLAQENHAQIWFGHDMQQFLQLQKRAVYI